MDLLKIPVPEVYTSESADFRFFLKWFSLCLSKVQYDTEEFFDLFDPLRCKEELLWLLGDTMGYVYDDRMIPAFNRLVLVYFMSMIRMKGSKDGVTLAAQVNLDQFNLEDQAKEKDILNNRLEDTSIPSNSVYVQPHVDKGYIDVVYFSDKVPVDACIEYVRPLGMYLVPHAGVRFDAKTRLTIDARLTNINDLNISISPTHVGHYELKRQPSGVYTEEDYSRMQRVEPSDFNGEIVKDTQHMSRVERKSGAKYQKLSDIRKPVWYRNSDYEVDPDENINPGYRALYSLQLINGEGVTQSLIKSVPNISSIHESDVSVYDDSTGEVYTNEYFQNRRRTSASRRDPLAYVPTEPMGTMGDSLAISSDEEDT